MKRDFEFFLGTVAIVAFMFSQDIWDDRKAHAASIRKHLHTIARYDYRQLICLVDGHVITWTAKSQRTYCARCLKTQKPLPFDPPSRAVKITLARRPK
jgi:hypothetical protein